MVDAAGTIAESLRYVAEQRCKEAKQRTAQQDRLTSHITAIASPISATRIINLQVQAVAERLPTSTPT